MKKCKISFRYESEEEYSEEDFKKIKENLKNFVQRKVLKIG